MNSIAQDLRFALRQLRHSPGFAITTILTLALGVGSAAAVFSVIDATLLRPLPYAHQERLVFPDTRSIAGFNQPWSLPGFLDARSELHSLQDLAGYTSYTRINLESPSGPVSLAAVKSTDNFFHVFGVRPLLGRTYLPGEDQPGRDDVAVLSYEVWQRDFGGQSSAVGKVVRLDGTPYTVIGVMPSGFRYPLESLNAIYIPLHPDPTYVHSRGDHWMMSVGLLKSGVTLPQAQADFNGVFANLARAYPESDTGRTVRLLPLRAAETGEVDAPLKTLGLAVLALLAIACVNVAGLLLARGVKREREMALRAAVGANRSRLIQQTLTESLVFSLAGLGLGVVFAWVLLRVMRTFLVSALARGVDVHLNLAALGVALLLSGATSILASLAPALRLSAIDPNRALRASASAGTGRGQQRLRSLFVVTQVALSLVLLVLSGLLLRNLSSLLTIRLGYPADKILTTQIALSPGRYANTHPVATLYEPLLDRVEHLPGVQAAGLINMLPIQSFGSNRDVHINGQPPYPAHLDVTAEQRFVTPGYFKVMGIQLLRGRMLSPGLDPWQNPGTIVVNQAFRRKFFSNGGDPVGAHLDDNDKTTIVGLVSDVRQDLREPPRAETDLLIDEVPPKDRLEMLSTMTLVVRAAGDPQQLVAPIRAALHDLDPTIPFQTPETMAQVVSDSLVFERLENWLFGIFAGFALLLAVIGLYGLMQHEVELRTRDIGIRMALGSTRVGVMVQILRRVAVLMAAGIGLGWSLTLVLQKVMASVIQLQAGHDAVLLLALTLSLGLVGVAATLLPARRAASIDPVKALRTE